VLIDLAHAAICVPDVEAATNWYHEVLGFEILSPPFWMEGDEITRDMGELLESPVVVYASIVGMGRPDHVIELIEYPGAPLDTDRVGAKTKLTVVGPSHVGLLCDDIERTRSDLEAAGVEFLTSAIASVARLRTAWFRDPWGNVFILMEKRRPGRTYWNQYQD
jgi:catechol 2,3-dioxygenase-like lactoylglutathione lyase family enzyme